MSVYVPTNENVPRAARIWWVSKNKKKHLCSFINCPSCHEYVNSREHKCYIQVTKSPEQEKAEKRKKKKRGAAASLATLAANGEPMDIDNEEKPPLHVFFDIEATDRIRFIDSLSFFQMPLSAFPKNFGLTELKKGYFQHLFNTAENQVYVGPIPAQHYYMPEVMSVSGRKAFETWHAKQTGTFNFAEELVAYCESDVKLLKEGCLTFKRLFEEQERFNPFDQMTIALACNRDLRQNRMEANTIASEPLHGWRLNSNHSKVALEWLCWEDVKLNRIQHAGNEGEYRIPNSNYTVDGYDDATKTVYKFQGCF